MNPNSIDEMTISVVIPAYNAASTIERCLKAIAGQVRKPDQVIVVDDGSTDGTAALASRFGVRVISQPNAGPAAARNRGARAALGDLLLFTDADCAPAVDWVQQMTALLADPATTAVRGAYRTGQRELVARFVQAEYGDRYDRVKTQTGIDFVDTYSAGYRREVFLAFGGFDTSLPIAEDQELSFRLAEAGHRLVFAPDAQVDHLHDRTVAEYARRKFGIGYWKARVVRAHPSKLVRDSHTPQTLKLQMGLAWLGALLVLAGLLDLRWLLAGLAVWGVLLLSGIPFLAKVWRDDRPVMLVAPLLLFVRAWALGLGFLLGTVRWLLRKP